LKFVPPFQGRDFILKILRFIRLTGLAMFIVACNSVSSQPALPPTLTPIVIEVVATPIATPTIVLPTTTLTRIPTATPFITPPANNQPAIVPILMYHHLADLPSHATELEQTWTVAPKNFEAQMAWLSQRGFHTITMAQLVAHLKDRQPLPSHPIIISFDDGWAEQYSIAFPILKRYGFIGTFFVYTNPLDRQPYLTWAQLQEMALARMDIQAHSLSHPHLRALPVEAAYKEIAESKAILEKRLGKPVIAFNYPFGEYNASVIEMVRRAGFESAVTLASGYKQRADELFTLHRIRISYNDSLDDLIKRLPQ
jgi:peptidoglycan/xylan/chitin deacetylase (PgdA/CDA1 family)